MKIWEQIKILGDYPESANKKDIKRNLFFNSYFPCSIEQDYHFLKNFECENNCELCIDKYLESNM